jgi:hypothetical protein
MLIARCKKLCHKIWNRLGFRGAFLALLGLFDVFYGLSLLVGGLVQVAFPLGIHTWGWIWIGTGFFLMTGSLVKTDRWQFGWAVFVKILWAMTFFYMEIIYTIPWDWLRGLYWGIAGIIILLISAWPEPVKYIENDDIIARAENGHK